MAQDKRRKDPLLSDDDLEKYAEWIDEQLRSAANFLEQPDDDTYVETFHQTVWAKASSCKKWLMAAYGRPGAPTRPDGRDGEQVWRAFLHGDLTAQEANELHALLAENDRTRGDLAEYKQPGVNYFIFTKRCDESWVAARAVLEAQDPEEFASEKWAHGEFAEAARARVTRDRARRQRRLARAAARRQSNPPPSYSEEEFRSVALRQSGGGSGSNARSTDAHRPADETEAGSGVPAVGMGGAGGGHEPAAHQFDDPVIQLIYRVTDTDELRGHAGGQVPLPLERGGVAVHHNDREITVTYPGMVVKRYTVRGMISDAIKKEFGPERKYDVNVRP